MSIIEPNMIRFFIEIEDKIVYSDWFSPGPEWGYITQQTKVEIAKAWATNNGLRIGYEAKTD